MCAAIPVIKVLRESLVVTNVHRVLGIVNGTTNFILTRDGGGRRVRRRRSPRRSGSATPRPTRPRTSPAPTRRRRWRSSRRSRSARASTLDDVAVRRASSASRPEHVARRARARDGRAARRRRDARRRPASTSASAPRSSTGTTRSPRSRAPFNAVMLQGDAIREITLEGPGAGGHRDRVGRRRRHGQRHRHDRHRLPPERRRAGASSSACPPGELRVAVLPPDRGRRPARRARARRAAARRRTASRSRGCPAASTNGGAALHVVTHEAPRARRGALARSRAARDAVGADRAPRHLRPRRRGAGLRRDRPCAPAHRALPRPPAASRRRRRSSRSARARRRSSARRGCRSGSASSSGSSGRARTRPGRSRTAG